MNCPNCKLLMKTIARDSSAYIHFWCPNDGIYIKVDTLVTRSLKTVEIFTPIKLVENNKEPKKGKM